MKKQALQLPLWLPADAWRGYEIMRKSIKKPLTDYSRKLAINKLAELMAQGHSATAVLEQSIFNSWQGLFEIRGGQVNGAKVGTSPRPADFGVKVRPEVIERDRLRNARNHD